MDRFVSVNLYIFLSFFLRKAGVLCAPETVSQGEFRRTPWEPTNLSGWAEPKAESWLRCRTRGIVPQPSFSLSSKV